MGKFNLLKMSFAAACIALAAPSESIAQQKNMLAFDGNFYMDYIGERIMITSPANMERNLIYTISNDGTGATGEWGAPVTDIPVVGQLVKANPYKACGTLSSLTGKIALILRGDCEFGTKAKYAQAAGAIAVIIVNHSAGGPINMGGGVDGASVTIPVLMISKEEGDILAAAIDNSTVIEMNMTKWFNGNTHDLGIVRSGISMWHNSAIPGSQMKNAANHWPYKGIDGAVVANFGSGTETNVILKSKVTFTPDGSTTPQIVKDHQSAPVATFAPVDSIKSIFIDDTYNMINSKQNGRYDFSYEVVANTPDEFPGDNKATHSVYVNDNVFSKGRYDFAKNEPIVPISFGYASGVSEYMRGPLYYMAEGGHQIEKVQISVSTGDADNNDLTSLSSMNTIIWKWEDGSNGQAKDSIMQSAETSIVGEGSYEFKNGDTSGQIFTLNINRFGTGTGTGNTLVGESNTWYWVTASLGGDAYLGADGQLNYYVRSFDRAHATSQYKEYYSVNFRDGLDVWQNTPDMSPDMFPSHAFHVDSVRFSQEKRGILPALPMIISRFPVSVKDMDSKDASMNIYPNPAKEYISITPGFAATSDNIHIKIIDGAGKFVKYEKMAYTAGKTYSISTKELPAGNYYLITNVGTQSGGGKFTVIAK